MRDATAGLGMGTSIPSLGSVGLADRANDQTHEVSVTPIDFGCGLGREAAVAQLITEMIDWGLVVMLPDEDDEMGFSADRYNLEFWDDRDLKAVGLPVFTHFMPATHFGH